MEKRGKNLTKEELKAMPLEELKQLVKKLHKRNWERNQGKDYVFISYSHADKDAKLVYELVAWFLQKGVSLSIDTEYSGESESWVRLMKGRLEDVNCKAMMAFYSENYVQSYPALMEFLYRYSIGVRMGRGKRKMPLIPVDLDQEGYIRKKVDELSHRSPELLKEDPNGEEIKCVEDGLEGLKNLDKNNVSETIKTQIQGKQEEARALQQLGYSAYLRDLRSDRYEVENIDNFFIDETNHIYVIYAYGNAELTDVTDVVIF